MGVRLRRFDKKNILGEEVNINDHDELINRDLFNQHPIYSISGLQEVLNTLEDTDYELSKLIVEKDTVTNKRIDAILKMLKDIEDMILNIGDMNVIKALDETYSLKLAYNEATKTLSGDVKVFEDKDSPNAIQVLAEGLYVPKTTTEDTNTIVWSIESRGETLKEIYDNGLRFSHNKNSWSNTYSPAEANAWYWDDSLQSFVQPKNTSYFTGFITQNFYDYYTHTVKLRSTDSDNDVNGVVIGFVFDENGNPHTLTALCERVGWTGVNNWALVYDFYLPDQQILFKKGNGPNGTVPGNHASSGWNRAGNGITVRVTKHKNIITATCSNWNSTVLNENTKITIDLNNYSWGHLFKKSVRYGYCNISQAYSFFQDIEFISDNSASSEILFASVKISEEAGNGIVEKEDGLYAEKLVISPEEGNAIEKRSTGYYVEEFKISETERNRLTKNDDGYYVKDQGNIIAVTQAAHELELGDFIYYNPMGYYKKALAIDDYDANIVGMVTEVIDTDNFIYQCSGFVKTDLFTEDNEYSQGVPLYISDTDAGKVTQQQPDISKAVGYPVENIGLIISIERGIQYNQEASIGDFKSSANTYNVRSDGFIRVVEGVSYKQTLIHRLLDELETSFKDSYLIIDNNTQTIEFQNTNNLYAANNVPDGFSLFIKAF